MRYPHIVFDVDGTLLDTRYGDLESLRDTLREFTGQAPPAEELIFAFGIPGTDSVQRLGVAEPEKFLARWVENLDRYCDTNHAFDGITALLDALTAAGCALGLVTSRMKAEIYDDPVLVALLPWFPVVISADDTDLHKPHADPLLKYMELTGCSRDQVLYIGDSEYDMACAAAAGVDSGLAGWGAVAPHPSTYVFQTPPDVLGVALS